MGINVEWIDEDGTVQQLVPDPKQFLTRLSTSTWPGLLRTVCLRFVDPFGDTVFNQAQIAELLLELRAEVAGQHDAEVRSHLEKVVLLVERSVQQTHTYIKFVGD